MEIQLNPLVNEIDQDNLVEDNLKNMLEDLSDDANEETCEYYVLGEIYMFENQEYLLTEIIEEAYIFASSFGNTICINADRIGTFPSNVASGGNEITRII